MQMHRDFAASAGPGTIAYYEIPKKKARPQTDRPWIFYDSAVAVGWADQAATAFTRAARREILREAVLR